MSVRFIFLSPGIEPLVMLKRSLLSCFTVHCQGKKIRGKAKSCLRPTNFPFRQNQIGPAPTRWQLAPLNSHAARDREVSELFTILIIQSPKIRKIPGFRPVTIRSSAGIENVLLRLQVPLTLKIPPNPLYQGENFTLPLHPLF